MKRALFLPIISFIFFLKTLPLLSCTSFAVYSIHNWYGMNFDYGETPIRISISNYGSKKVFRAHFSTSGYIAGINENGLFTNYQLLYYNGEAPEFASMNTLGIGPLNDYALGNSSTVDEVKDYIGNRLLVPSYGNSLHTLFADTSGDAMVVEPFGAVNGITPAMDNFLVMTNFPNFEFIGNNYTTVYGVGSERYIDAYEYIQTHINNFSYEDGIETLARTAQRSGDYPTQISLLFDLSTMNIYICLNHNFDKVWRVSFHEENVETYSGFASHIAHTLNFNGIDASQLLEDMTSAELTELSNPDFYYPNPSTGELTIKLNKLSDQPRVSISSMNGEVLLTQSLIQGSNIINLNDLGRGTYIVTLQNNARIESGKLRLE